jgi:hypothetical protein
MYPTKESLQEERTKIHSELLQKRNQFKAVNDKMEEIAYEDPKLRSALEDLDIKNKQGKIFMDPSHLGIYEKIGEENDAKGRKVVIGRLLISTPHSEVDSLGYPRKYIEPTPMPILNDVPVSFLADVIKGPKINTDIETRKNLARGVKYQKLTYASEAPTKLKKPISQNAYVNRQMKLIEQKS